MKRTRKNAVIGLSFVLSPVIILLLLCTFVAFIAILTPATYVDMTNSDGFWLMYGIGIFIGAPCLPLFIDEILE